LTKSGILSCFDKNRNKIWEYKIEGGALSSPSIDKYGNIYVGSLKSGLLVFTKKGRFKKRVDIKDEIRSTPILYNNKTILTTTNGKIIILNDKLEIEKTVKINNQSFSSPVFSKTGKSIIIPFKDYLILSMNLSGEILWRYKTKGVIFSSPAVSKNGYIYITSMDHNLYKLSPKGNLIWKFKSERWIISSPVIDKNGNIYFGSYDNFFYCISSKGRLKWKLRGSGAFNATPVIMKKGNIITGNSAGEIYNISPEGKLLWKFKTDDFFRIPITIFKKSAIAGNIDGAIYYFSIKEGISQKAHWPKYLGNLKNSGYKQ
jgi:outer membrane protein assembly factor BamB